MRRRISSRVVNSQIDITSERGQYRIGRKKFKGRNCCNIEANRCPIDRKCIYPTTKSGCIAFPDNAGCCPHDRITERKREREKERSGIFRDSMEVVTNNIQ